MGTPRYFKVYLRSIISSFAVFAATNSEPYVAVFTVAWFLEYQSVGVWLQKWRHTVTAAPAAQQWRRLASSVVVVVTDLPRGLGQLLGIIPEPCHTLYRTSHASCWEGSCGLVPCSVSD